MDFYDDFSLKTPFSYGFSHIKEGVKQLHTTNKTSKLNAIGEVCLGILECTPIIGIIPALIEKKIANGTVEKRLKLREDFIKKEVDSDSFALQELYFDIFSSNQPGKSSMLNVQRILDNSTPDRAVASLIRDLERFSSGISVNLKDREKLLKLKSLLEEAKPIALLVGEIVTSKSKMNKERVRKELKKLIKEKVENLQDGDKLLIPCGYMNGNIYDVQGLLNGSVNGHSILMRLEKVDGKFKAAIFNTGEGISDHAADEDSLYGRYFPLYYDGIPEDELVSGSFIDELTSFSINEENNKENSSHDVYTVLNKHFGQPRQIDKTEDLSYKSQGSVNNCTKKCLQVWLHDELKDSPLYKRFRIFRLNQKMARVEGILTKCKKVRYSHPMARYGSKSKNLFFGMYGSLRGLLTGSNVVLKVSKKDIEGLMDFAKKVLDSREGKLLAKRGVRSSSDDWDFEGLNR